jgi:hypothetical protein
VTITKIPLTLLGTQPAEKDGHRFTYVAANNAIELVSSTDAVFSIPDGGGSSGPYAYGTVEGYALGASIPTAPLYRIDTVQTISFTSDISAVDTAELTYAQSQGCGVSSETTGYTLGGYTSNSPGIGDNDVIQKYTFSSSTASVSTATLSGNRIQTGPTGSMSTTNGYVAGGSPNIDIIEKIAFATDTNGVDIGELIAGKSDTAQISSDIFGYVAGGASPSVETLQKYPFTSDSPAIDIGELAWQYVRTASGHSSATNGYTAGGQGAIYSAAANDVITKFTYSSDSPATDIAELAIARAQAGSLSSSTFGYVAGSPYPGFTSTDSIEKFSFSSDSSGVDIAELVIATFSFAGAQT